MIKVYCKRDFKGMIDVRSHIAEKAIKKGESIKITCGTLLGEMILTPEDISHKLVRKQGPYKSKFDKDYYLYVYQWEEE